MASNNDLDGLNTELKKELSSLIISSAKGLTVKRLRFDYQEFFGSDVPFKRLGFNNFEQYLLSIPNTCRLTGSGDHALVVPVVTEKNKHINDMILKQKAPKTKSRFRPPRRCRGIYNIRREPAPPSKPVVPFKLPVLNPDSHKVLLPPPHDYVLEMRRQQNDSTKKFNHKNLRENHISNSCDNRLSNNYPRNETEKSSTFQSNVQKVNNYPRDDMYRIEEPGTSGLQTNSHKYENKFTEVDSDEDSDAEFYQELGFSEEEDFCYKSEDDEDLTTCISNMALRDNLPCAMLDMPLVEEPHISRVNKKVKEKLQRLIADYPDGIWCSKLLRYYEEKYHQKLEPENFGFSSVIQMCDDLPDVFYCIRPNRMDWKLYDKTKPVPDIHTMRDFSKYLQTLPVSQDRSNTEPALPADIMFTPSYKYPEDVLHPGEMIERQWLVNYEKTGEYIELVISEVYDPSKFWIQFKGPTTSEALAKVMDDMQVYYMHHAGTLQLNEFSVRIGLMCSALFMNEFHRAIVIKVFDDQTIKVFYVDYGTVGQVQLKRTCFLHRSFAELPMQAVRARLANIKPIEPNTMWPRAASSYMLQLIMEKDLIAYLYQIDQDNKILELVVTDTTMPDIDIHINDMLIEKGYAVLGNEAPLCESSSALVPNVHLYPTFEELENFIYPSVGDVITMLKLGYTYETIFDGYFATSANSTNPHNYSDLHHSRSSTSMGQTSSQSFCAEHEPISEEASYCDPEETNADFVEVQQEDSTHVVDENEPEPDNITESESVESGSNEQPISPINSKSSLDEETFQYEENFTGPPPPGFRNCPPGFENVQPNANQFNTFRREPAVPLLPDPVYNLNHLAGYPLTPLPNYPLMNPAYNLLLSNPLLYNQLIINQQKEALQREVLMQTVQQVKFVEEIQRLKLMNQQQQYARVHQATNPFPQNYNVPNASQNQSSYFSQYQRTPQNSKSGNTYGANGTQVRGTTSNISNDVPSYRIKPNQTNLHDDDSNNYYDQATSTVSSIISNANEHNKESISNISEHICDRFVVKLKLKDCIIHVLKIDTEFYVVSQEIISNLLKYDLPLKMWMKSVNLNASSFPNKLVNIMNYENVYNQIKSYSIPGVNPPNNLGCNVRLTSLNDVVDIVEQFGNINILPDLKAGIKHVMEKPDMWKVLDSSD